MSAVKVQDQTMNARVNVSILISTDEPKVTLMTEAIAITKLLTDAGYFVDSHVAFKV